MGNDMEQDKDKRIAELLASFGANRASWPEAGRTMGAGAPDAERSARAVDHVLSLASEPALPGGAMDRLLAKLDAAEAEAVSNVVAFPAAPRREARRFFRFAAAIPLAASLMLGFYLGAQGALDTVLPTAITGSVALNDDAPDDLGGIGDIEAYAEDSTS